MRVGETDVEPARTRPLVRSILTVAGGSALGSLIGFAISPALTRLFSPAEFGVFSVVVSLVAILLSIVTGRMELAVPLPERDSEARDLILIGAAIATTTIAALTVVAWLAPDLVASVTPTGLDGMFLAVPVLLVPVASFMLLNAWAIRHSRYRAIATRNVAQAAVTAMAQLGLGVAGAGIAGLAAGYFIGQLVGALALAYRSGLGAAGPVTMESVRAAGSEYRRYPLMLAPTGFVNALGIHAPVLLVAATFGATAAGLMALTQRVMSVPMALVGQSTAQVYISELARSHRSSDAQELLPLFWRTTRLLSLLGLALILVGAPLSYLLFGAIFGAEWEEAGTLTALMTLGAAAQLVGSSVSQTLVVFRRLWTIVLWDVGRLTTTTLVLVLAWRAEWSLTQAIALLSAVTVLVYALYWWLSHRTLTTHVARLSAA